MGRKSTLRHHRYQHGSSALGYGRLLLVPFVVMRSLGRRAFSWLLLRQQRFMHSRTSSDVEATLRDLNIELERSYKTHPSPLLRPPHHLRPRPLRSVWKVYVPRRRLSRRKASLLLEKGHYQIPKGGRPVPVSPDIVKYLTLGRRRKPSLQCTQKKTNIPEYLCFSNGVNIRDEQTSLDFYSSSEEVSSDQSLSTNQSTKSASSRVSFAPDIESSIDTANGYLDLRLNSSNIDDESSSFATSEKISPKLLEVVASLRAKASSSLSSSFEINNLNKRASSQRRVSDHACTVHSENSRHPNGNNINSTLNISNDRCSIMSGEGSNFRPLSRKTSSNPTVSSDSDNENGVNFMRIQEKNYRKSMLRLTESSSVDENSLYDSSEPVYDVILDSGYSTVVESSQESVRSCSTDSHQQSLGSEKYTGSSISNENSTNALSRSLSSLKIDHKVTVASLDVHENQSHSQEDTVPWKTQSAEELSICNLAPSALFYPDNEKLPVSSPISPEPQKSFLHTVVKRLPVSVTTRGMLPPLPDSSLPPLFPSSSSATRVLPRDSILPTATVDIQSPLPKSSIISCSNISDVSVTPQASATSSSGHSVDGVAPHLDECPSVNIATALRESPSCSSNSTIVAEEDSTCGSRPSHQDRTEIPRTPLVACEVGCSIFYVPISEYCTSAQNSTEDADEGSGDPRGGSFPPTKGFPPSTSKPSNPASTAFKPPVPPFNKDPQLPPLPSRPVTSPAKPLVHASNSSKPAAKSLNSPAGKSNVSHHPVSDSLSVILRNHQAANRGNEPMPNSSSLSGGVSPAPLHLPPSTAKKPPLVVPNRSSDPSANTSRSATNTSLTSTTGSNMLRRPTPTGGIQLPTLSSQPEAPDVNTEAENPEDSQESVRLSDGSRVDLTPLYKSLVQRDYFHLVSRKRAEEMLLENPSDGMFVVRPSSTEHPLTLAVVSQGSCSNIFIRQRPDRLFALGEEKHNEVVFKSVDELIEHHLQKPLKLNSGQEVLLTTSPGHHSSHVYVRMPISRLANSIAA